MSKVTEEYLINCLEAQIRLITQLYGELSDTRDLAHQLDKERIHLGDKLSDYRLNFRRGELPQHHNDKWVIAIARLVQENQRVFGDASAGTNVFMLAYYALSDMVSKQ